MEAAVEDEYTLKNYQFLMELIAGGCCGLAVDGILFPIDTCKTRLQSEKGFWRYYANTLTHLLSRSLDFPSISSYCISGRVVSRAFTMASDRYWLAVCQRRRYSFACTVWCEMYSPMTIPRQLLHFS